MIHLVCLLAQQGRLLLCELGLRAILSKSLECLALLACSAPNSWRWNISQAWNETAWRYTQNFNALSEAFPDRDWAWVRPPMDKDWPVTDGLHLTAAAAEAFARVLAKDLEGR